MIVSIPHTGTRTLVNVLNDDDIVHFDKHHTNVLRRLSGPIHVPIRDPLESLASYIAYSYPRNDEYIERATIAVDYLSSYLGDVTYHVVEDIDIREGRGPTHPIRGLILNRDYSELCHLERFRQLTGWYKRPEIREFFGEFYSDLWWDR